MPGRFTSRSSPNRAPRATILLPGIAPSGRTEPWTRLLIVAGLCLAAAASPARAEFTVCNQTLDVVNLAIGQEVDSAFQTEGWWTVGANQCAEVIREELANRFIYVYANDVFGQPILSGTTEMCVGRKRFVIRGIESCWQRGHLAAKFYEVDTQAVERWTLFLTSPSVP